MVSLVTACTKKKREGISTNRDTATKKKKEIIVLKKARYGLLSQLPCWFEGTSTGPLPQKKDDIARKKVQYCLFCYSC